MVAYLALPDFRNNAIVEIIVPIEILREAEIYDETSVPETAVEEPEDEPETQSEPEPAPIEPEPEPDLEPEEIVPPLPDPEPEVEEKEPEPDPEPGRDELDIGSLEDALKDLDPDKDRAAPRETPLDVGTSESNQDRVGLGDRLTATEYDRLKAHVQSGCWNIQSFIGAPEPEKLIVEVEFNLNPDGSVFGDPRVLNRFQISTSGNAFWRVAERAAINAVLECAPYDFLPVDKYEDWKEVELRFNPADMAGL